jgi:hypothetical protein
MPLEELQVQEQQMLVHCAQVDLVAVAVEDILVVVVVVTQEEVPVAMVARVEGDRIIQV